MTISNSKICQKILSWALVGVLTFSGLSNLGVRAQSTGKTYYVSTSGSDSNNGTTEALAFKSIAKINSLDLIPGDNVLFKCGETWQGESLEIKNSGTTFDKITFGSFPQNNCANKPAISGSKAVSGWNTTNGRANVYEVDLNSGNNMGNFPNGINQLFKNDQKLQFGRYPNIDAPSGGYTKITAQNSGNQITLQDLPNKDWTGANVHIMGMRWYILNRNITGNSGNTLNLNAGADCWGGNCAADGGWGAWVDNSIETLDQEGEWYFDKAANKVFVYSQNGVPSGIEASVINKTEGRSDGGIMLGKDFDRNGISNVVVDNFEVKNWYKNGIAAPINFAETENHDLIIKNNLIKNIEESGISLATWVFDAKDGRESNWRGGYNLKFENNTIDGANHFGIDTYSRNSEFVGNTIMNIGLIKNLDASGMGCGFEGSNCTENGDGIRIKNSNPADSGNNNLFKFNTIKKTGYNGIDVLGPNNTLEKNYIDEPCYSKGDCGGIRNFGGANAKNTVIKDNIITNSVGNTDGANTAYKELFGFGIYVDYASDNAVITGNTVKGSTNTGLTFIDSQGGTISGNTIYGNAKGTTGREEISVDGDNTTASFNNNIGFSIKPETVAFRTGNKDKVTNSDNNYFFNQFSPDKISVGADGNVKTLANWQTYSGKDAGSKTDTFTQTIGEQPKSQLFYNPTQTAKTIALTQNYKDLNQNPVSGSITLQPFTSIVLLGDVIISSSSSSSIVSSSSSSISSSISSLPSSSSVSILNSSQNLSSQNSLSSISSLVSSASLNPILSSSSSQNNSATISSNSSISSLANNSSSIQSSSPTSSISNSIMSNSQNSVSSISNSISSINSVNSSSVSSTSQTNNSSLANSQAICTQTALQNAINSATNGDTININCPANTKIAFTSEILLNKNLIFDGQNSPNLSFDGQNATRLFTISGGTTTFKNLTFENGRTAATDNENPESTTAGGAILTGNSVTLNLENTNFRNNTAGVGGAVYSGFQATLNVLNSTFDSNKALAPNSATERSGGAIATKSGGNTIIKGSSFVNNSSEGIGGALNILLGSLSLEDSIFKNNTSKAVGGAIYTDGASEKSAESSGRTGGNIVIKNTRFENNVSGQDGGAAYLFTYPLDKLDIADSTFIGNKADNGIGGALRLGLNNTNITNTAFILNQAKNAGAVGIQNPGNLNMKNVLFEQNKAAESGGAIVAGSDPGSKINIENATFNKNFAGNYDGAITLWNKPEGDVILKNSVFFENKAGNPYNSGQNTSGNLGDGGNNFQFPNTYQNTTFTGYTNVTQAAVIKDPLLTAFVDTGKAVQNTVCVSESTIKSAGAGFLCPTIIPNSSYSSVNSTFSSLQNSSVSSLANNSSSIQSSSPTSSISNSISSTNSTNSANSNPPNSSFQVGMGLGGQPDWTPAPMYLDIMKTSRLWEGRCPETKPNCERYENALDLDVNGYPKSLNSKIDPSVKFTHLEMPLLTNQGFESKVKYVIKYDGIGKFDYGFVSDDNVTRTPGKDTIDINGMFWLKLVETDPTNPIKNVRVVRADQEAMLDGGQIFNPEWLDKFKKFNTFRYMDLMGTNGSKQKDWANRPTKSYISWNERGIPAEIIVELSKQSGVDAWINMPHLATDDYMKQFATLLKDTMPKERKIYLEFSNEVWNWQFDQAQVANTEGRKILAKDTNNNGVIDQSEIDQAPGESWVEWHGMKSYQMCKIWKETFVGQNNLKCGIGSQTAWHGMEDSVTKCPDIVAKGLTDGKECASNADFFYLSGYFSGYLAEEATISQVKSWLANPDPEFAFKQAFQQIKDSSVLPQNGDSVKDTIENFRYFKNFLKAKYPSMELNVYEGGSGTNGNGSPSQEDQQMTDFFIAINRRPEMYDIYKTLLQGAKDEGVSLFNHFVDVGAASKWGSWGSLESLDQPLSTAYRYCSLLDFQTGVKNCQNSSSSSSVSVISVASISSTNLSSVSSSSVMPSSTNSPSNSASSSTSFNSQSSSQASNQISSSDSVSSSSQTSSSNSTFSSILSTNSFSSSSQISSSSQTSSSSQISNSVSNSAVSSSNSVNSSSTISSNQNSNSSINPDQIWNNSSIPSYLIEDNNLELTPKKSENTVYGTQDLILKVKNLPNGDNSKCYFQIRRYPTKDNPNPVFGSNLLTNFATNWTNGSCQTILPKEMQSQNKWQMRVVVVYPTGIKSEILPDIMMNTGAFGSVTIGGISID